MPSSRAFSKSGSAVHYGISIIARDLSAAVRVKRNRKQKEDVPTGDTKVILKRINACFKKGKLTAILGPSGSGKTSLLNILSGRVRSSLLPAGTDLTDAKNVSAKSTTLAGEILYNGQPLSPDRVGHYSSYVMQSDALLPYLTVDETLKFAAKLKLKGFSKEQRAERVEEVLAELGLCQCRDVLIGGQMRKGISGGQKRRVSIAIELLNNPDLVFLDEPTSGLDSSLAFDVVNVLSNLAASGRTVILTIHQPRHETYALLDELVLMCAGELCYHGEASRAIDYFAEIGFQCPPTFNPADFVLDLMNPKTNVDDDDDLDNAEEQRIALDQSVIDQMAAKFQNHPLSVSLREEIETTGSKLEALPEPQYGKDRNPFSLWFAEFWTICERFWLQCMRDPMTTVITCTTSLIFGLVSGAIFWQLAAPSNPYDCIAIFSILGTTNFLVTNLTFSTMASGARFPEIRPMFNRESSNGMYSASAFFCGKAVAEFLFQEIPPFILSTILFWMSGIGSGVEEYFIWCAYGCLCAFCSISFANMVGSSVPIFPIAIIIIPNTYVLMMFFGGFLLTDDQIPSWIGWLKWVSIIRYEFDGVSELVLPGSQALKNCFYLPENLSYWENFGIIFGMAMIFKGLAIVFLKFTNRTVGLQS